MSISSISSGSALATVGISTARPGQDAAIRETVASVAPDKANAQSARDEKTNRPSSSGLTPAEQRRVAELERIDAQVRAHEQAHINVGRGLITSGPNYEYTYGPDGKQYAIAGEVGIDTSAEREAQANIDKGQQIQATALAPIDPSAQDYRVAATGKQLEQQGRRDLRSEQNAQATAPRDARLEAYTKQSTPDGANGNLNIFA